MNANKDNVEMICSIGELASLFEGSHSIEDFLQTAVKIVATHMKAAVCSIYLLEDNNKDLVLRANQGLSADSVGRVKLRLGEGITGQALKELRPIREGRGSQNPNFKHIPGINEEQYEAFLAVPIVHGLRRVGVLVVQDPQPDYFTEADAKALRAIAAQLATTIENAQLLMSLHRETKALEAQETTIIERLSFLRGKPASPGIAKGRAIAMGQLDAALWNEDPHAVDGGVSALDRSLERSEKQLAQMQRDVEERLTDIASLIFSTQILMLKDHQFAGEMRRLIEEEHRTAQQAIQRVSRQYMDLFAKSPNPRLREKVQDIKDVGQRLLRNLSTGEDTESGYHGHVVVVEDILPSDILKLAAQGAEGILMIGGGMTAHISILARSLQLPMVITEDRNLVKEVPGRQVLLDGNQGSVFLEPSQEILERYDNLIAAQREAAAVAAVEDETFTRDGTRVRLLANINLLSDLKIAQQLRAEGIGLYRSEFPFIVRNTFPSEEEQYQIYRKIVTEMAGREIVFRTLDIGGDKMLSYFPHVDEANPFLGLRAIRFSLKYPDIFSQQLRALLRAGVDADIKIMFPLISSLDEFLQAREGVRQACDELKESGVPHNPHPKLGVMVELPSAVEIVEDLAREADFLSIGTNDLVQYMLAVDRTNDEISDLYVYHHPAVLRVIARIVRAAQTQDVDLSICGDMAAEPRMVPFLLGAGLRKFSVNPNAIPALQRFIQNVDLSEAETVAKNVLQQGRIDEIARMLGVPASNG